MKITTILLVSLFAYTQCRKATISDCVKKSGLTIDMYIDFERGHLDRPELGSFLFCFHKSVGIQDEAGKLQASAIKRFFKKKKIGQKIRRKIEKKCLKNYKTPEKTALRFEICANFYITGHKSK